MPSPKGAIPPFGSELGEVVVRSRASKGESTDRLLVMYVSDRWRTAKPAGGKRKTYLRHAWPPHADSSTATGLFAKFSSSTGPGTRGIGGQGYGWPGMWAVGKLVLSGRAESLRSARGSARGQARARLLLTCVSDCWRIAEPAGMWEMYDSHLLDGLGGTALAPEPGSPMIGGCAQREGRLVTRWHT